MANLSGDQNSLQDILIGQASKAFKDEVSHKSKAAFYSIGNKTEDVVTLTLDCTV